MQNTFQEEILVSFQFEVELLENMSYATFFPPFFGGNFCHRNQKIANRIFPMIWNIHFFPSTFTKKGKTTKIIGQNPQLHYHFCQKKQEKSKNCQNCPLLELVGQPIRRRRVPGGTSFWMLIGWESAIAARGTWLYPSLLTPVSHVIKNSLLAKKPAKPFLTYK